MYKIILTQNIREMSVAPLSIVWAMNHFIISFSNYSKIKINEFNSFLLFTFSDLTLTQKFASSFTFPFALCLLYNIVDLVPVSMFVWLSLFYYWVLYMLWIKSVLNIKVSFSIVWFTLICFFYFHFLTYLYTLFLLFCCSWWGNFFV